MKKLISLLISAVFCFAALGACAPADAGDGADSATVSGQALYAEPELEGTWAEDGMPTVLFDQPAEVMDYLDLRYLPSDVGAMYMTFKAVVNTPSARVYTQASPDNWLSVLNIPFRVYTDYLALMYKYRDEFDKVIIYDPAENPDTVNLAYTYAGLTDAIAVTPRLYQELTDYGFDLTVIADYRGMFPDRVSVYQYMYDNYWEYCTHKMITGMDPAIMGCLQDYSIACKNALVWLNVNIGAERELLVKFCDDMPALSAYWGWMPDACEQGTQNVLSPRNIMCFATNYCENQIFWTGYNKGQVIAPPETKVPQLENKLYISLVVSDGDSYQTQQHRMRAIWNSPQFGNFPLSFTFLGAAYIAQPAIMNYYHARAYEYGDKIGFLSSLGACYTYTHFYTGENRARLLQLNNKYAALAKTPVINNWSNEGPPWVTPLTKTEKDTMGEYYTDVLAVYDQAPMYPETNRNLLISQFTDSYVDVGQMTEDGGMSRLMLAYETSENIYKACEYNEPVFLTIQIQPWIFDYNNYGKDLMVLLDEFYNEVKDNRGVEFVTIEQYAMLERMSVGMSPTL